MFKRYFYRNYQSFASLKYKVRRRVTLAGWFVGGATVATAALGADTNLAVAYQSFAFLFCLVVVAGVAVRWSGRKLEVERILPRYGSAGQALRYRLVVQNRSSRACRSASLLEEMADPRPTFEEFANSHEPGEEKRNWVDRSFGFYRYTWLVRLRTLAQIGEVPVPAMAGNSSREIEAELMPLRRGVLRLTGVTTAMAEPFGLFRALRTVSTGQSVLILPKRYPMPAFELPGKSKYQQGGVSMASSVGESEEFVALREYRPGDPLRRIHWKSFAKVGKPIVKEYQDEFFVRHALALDTFIAQASEEFEEAVSVAASLAFTLQDHDSLLDLMFVGPQAYCFTAGRGVAHTEQMMEILASVQPCQDKDFGALQGLVLNHASRVSGCICVLLSWDEGRQQFVRALRMLNVPVLVFVITREEKPLEPGPMADQPNHLQALPIGRIAEVLAHGDQTGGLASII